MQINAITEHLRSKLLALNTGKDLKPLYSAIGANRVVLLGEATHGTKEFYLWRKIISKHLISEKNFKFIAVEGDWPACFEVDKYIKGKSNISLSDDLLKKAFNRWPQWMWANDEVKDLIDWLKQYNQDLEDEDKIGFYGLDVYSLTESFFSIIEYLKKNEPKGLDKARKAFECSEAKGMEGHEYARSLAFIDNSCEEEVLEVLKHMNKKSLDTDDNLFNAKQNATIIKNAEKYYRSLVSGEDDSWNIRDRHMLETLKILFEYHKNKKAIIWAHNTHIGDARATDMMEDSLLNLGQLVREEYKKNSFAIGFGTFKGKVLAGDSWGSDVKIMDVPEATENTWEHLMHSTYSNDFLLIWDEEDRKKEFLKERFLHRAIGVTYSPKYELNNYVPSVMLERYDAFIHIDKSSNLVPLKKIEADDKVPETYPSGL